MKTMVIIAAWGASALSITFLSSWHLGLLSVLQLPPSTWPIPYDAALCLLLSGFALFALLSTFRFPLEKIFGVMIFTVGFQRVAEL